MLKIRKQILKEVGGSHGRLIRYMYSIRVKERNTDDLHISLGQKKKKQVRYFCRK